VITDVMGSNCIIHAVDALILPIDVDVSKLINK